MLATSAGVALSGLAFAGCEELGDHSLRATPNLAEVGQNVEFYALVRSFEDDDDEYESVARDRIAFRWDLDGDGEFETPSPTSVPPGTHPDFPHQFDTTASRAYDSPQTIEVASMVSLRSEHLGAIGGYLGLGGDASVARETLTIEGEPPPGPDPPPDSGNKLPLASFTVSPNPAQPHEQVLFDGSGSADPDGSIVRYEWDIDGIGDFDRDTGATPYTQRHYDNSGDYTVRLRVTDDEGATAVTSRQVVVRWPTRTGRAATRATAMPRFELAPEGRPVNEGQYLLNGNELILNRARARGTLGAEAFPPRLRGSHDVRWAADYVVTNDLENGAAHGEAFVLLTFATGGRACLGADLRAADGENPSGDFRVIGAIGKASRLRGLGTVAGRLDEDGRPIVSGRGRFRLGKHAEYGLGKSRCGPLRRLAPQRNLPRD